MVRIYGISAEVLDVIRPFATDAREYEYESGLYVVQLYENVHVHYSFDDVQISDGEMTVTLEMSDFERIVIS